MRNRERKYFSVFDILIILVAVTASLLALFSQLNSSNDDLTCVIKVEGEVVKTVPLSSVDEAYSLEIDGALPVVVRLTNSSVKVETAFCPDKLCEHTGEITRSGQSIVCLPAKVSVTLESSKTENEFDAVVR